MENNYKNLWIMYLSLAIIGTILSIPGLNKLDFFSILSIGSVVLAGMLMYYAQKNSRIKKTGALLYLIGSVVLFIAGVIFVGSFIGSLGGSFINGDISSAQIGGFLSGGIFFVIFGLVGWIIRLVGIVLSYIAFSDLKKIADSEGIDQQ